MDSSPWVIFLCLLSLYPSPGLGQIPTNEHLITASVAPTEANIDTLEYVQVIWRHGDRSPAAVFDPQEEKLWPEGLGELTKTGMGQHYRLGKWLRQRYGKFLNEHFDRQEVYVRSSDFNRTLMSALANMAGLFPPQQKEVWDQELLWQPVPVHSVPKLQDKQLYEDIPCPLAEIENQIIYGSSVVKDIEKENADFLKFLADRTNSSNSGLGAMWRVYDSLNCQFYHNKTHHWPVWVNQSVFEQVVRLYDIGSRLKFHTEFLRRIRGGPLVEEMYHRFLDKSEGRLGSRAKLYAYSAHDTTLAAFLATLDIYPERFPLYATAVIVELHRVDGQPVVELYRKNITDSPILYRTEIPGCGASCTLDGLHSIMSKYFPQNWEGECGYKQETLTPYIVAIVILSTTTAIFGGILIFDIILKRRARPIGDSSLQSEPLINEADT